MTLPAKKLRVVIVEDNFLFSMALETVVKLSDTLEMVARLNGAPELFTQIDELLPDVILMDIRMPEMDGITATKLILEKYPSIKIVAVTAHGEGNTVKEMMEAGAWGFINKDCDKKEYDILFDRLMNNQKYISPDAAINYSILMNDKMMKVKKGKKATQYKNNSKPVTKREIEVIQHIARGFSDKEIADALNVSHRTIDAHKQNAMHKLGTRKATELVSIAHRLNLL